jgi:hypothetical protein
MHWCFCFAGERLHDVQIDIIGNGANHPCGYYPGPGGTGDRIEVLCRNGAVGDSMKMQILSKGRQSDALSICEVEVYAIL